MKILLGVACHSDGGKILRNRMAEQEQKSPERSLNKAIPFTRGYEGKYKIKSIYGLFTVVYSTTCFLTQLVQSTRALCRRDCSARSLPAGQHGI
jgi:hypothetical protein